MVVRRDDEPTTPEPRRGPGRDTPNRADTASSAARYPRGYGRPAEQIRDDIQERMHGHGYLDRSDIRVKVRDQEVSLQGTVTDERARRLAQEIAQGVAGVRRVDNMLEIGLPPRARARLEEPGEPAA
jgi:osmotically-inducible protein OsmY